MGPSFLNKNVELLTAALPALPQNRPAQERGLETLESGVDQSSFNEGLPIKLMYSTAHCLGKIQRTSAIFIPFFQYNLLCYSALYYAPPPPQLQFLSKFFTRKFTPSTAIDGDAAGTSQPSRATKPTEPPPSSTPSSSHPSTTNISVPYCTSTSYQDSSTASISSRTSLSNLRDSLPETAHVYEFSEIRTTTNFHAASSAASCCCTLRGKDVVVFQRKLRRSMDDSQLGEMLSVICRSYHMSVIKLLGASVSGDHIYLVYEFINGVSLADCLRNPRNPSYTVLSTWISRMQVATDVAHGLDYIHNNTGRNIGLVHKHITACSIVVADPSLNGKICHFGMGELCGETDENMLLKPELKRLGSRSKHFEGVVGYMSPEFKTTGIATQKSDVYAFGVVMLELLSGEEPLKYKFEKGSGNFVRTSVIETARDALEGGGGETWRPEGRLRIWMDRRLNDSFPVGVAERVVRVALQCVHVDPDERPGMRVVAGKISKLYLDSKEWWDGVRVPTDISVSLEPR